MPRYTDHTGLVITTSSRQAAARYADGVDLLVDRSPDAVVLLRAAVAADPALGVAIAALAWATRGQAVPHAALVAVLGTVVTGSAPATRRERQHVEIVLTALRGDRDRARALGSEHLREFPADVLVAHVIDNGLVDPRRTG